MDAKFVFISGVSKNDTPMPQPVQHADKTSASVAESGNVRSVEGMTPVSTLDEKRTSSGQAEEKTLDEIVTNLNQHVQRTTRALHFHVDERYGRPIVSVVDKETNEVIRQIPTEVALQVADALDEVIGMMVSERA